MKGRYAKNFGVDWRMRSQGVSLAAEGLNTRAESYCADVQSDGYVPLAFLTAMCGGRLDRKTIDELVAAGWWVAQGAGYLLVQYTTRNGTKADAEAKAKSNAERQQRFRDSNGDGNGTDDDGSNAPSNGARNALRKPSRNASPSPSPSPSPSHHSSRENQISSADADSPPLGVREVFDHWAAVMGKSRAKLDAKRRKLIAKAIEDYDLETCKRAVDGCAASPFHMGDNDRAKRFDSLELIFRDAKHIEDFANPGAAGGKRDPGWRPPVSAAQYALSASDDDEDRELSDEVTDEDRARLVRIGGRAAHG